MTADTVIRFSSYKKPALTQTRAYGHVMPWSALSENLQTHIRSLTKDVKGWTPAIYIEGSTRKNEAVVAVSCAVADFDHCTFETLASVKDRLGELTLAYAIYSTFTCNPPDDVRFRVVIPFSEPVPKQDWEEAWLRVNHHVFGGQNDPATKDPSRFYYVPSAPPDTSVFAEQHDGNPLMLGMLPPAPPEVVAAEHEPLGVDLIFDGIPEGERDSTLYRYACKMRGDAVPINVALLAIAAAAERCRPPFDVLLAESKVIEAYKHFQPNLQLTVNGNGHIKPSDLEETAPFPVDALPEALQRYVARASGLMACPPEYVAVPLLVAAGTTLGNVTRVRLNSKWFEGPQLFAAIVGDPGSKKSPAIKTGTAPLKSLEKWLYDGWKQKNAQYQVDHETWKSAKKDERGEEPQAPPYPYVLVNDVTVEKLAEILKDAKGVALIHDELASWVSGMGQYKGGKGADRQHYLSMWSASSFNVDRVKNPIPVRVVNPCLGVIGALVPEMLGSLADEKGRADGFMDRILWSYPEMIPDQWVDDDGDNSDLTELTKLWQWLYSVQEESVTFSAEAYALWVHWYDDHVGARNDKSLETEMAGPWAKMLSQLPRLALILHYIERSTERTIARDTLERAIKLVDYFKAHARKVYAELGAQPGNDGLKLLEGLKQNGPMSQTTVWRRVFQCHLKASKLKDVLTDLEERGLVKKAQEATAGRPAWVWSIT